MQTFVESENEREFITYLVKNSAYTAFMRNMGYNHADRKSWTVFKKEYEYKSEMWVRDAFRWVKSDYPHKNSCLNWENHDFWKNLDEDWLYR